MNEFTSVSIPEWYNSEFIYKLIARTLQRRFNSRVVQFRGKLKKSLIRLDSRFNSRVVQFREYVSIAHNDLDDVSIPEWYNSEEVYLYTVITSYNVSIPEWYNSEQKFSQYFAELPEFQFQSGTIQSPSRQRISKI